MNTMTTNDTMIYEQNLSFIHKINIKNIQICHKNFKSLIIYIIRCTMGKDSGKQVFSYISVDEEMVKVTVEIHTGNRI